jgi:hypothetical protein
MAKTPEIDDETKRIMGALVRMPPKPHDEMKLGKPKGKPKKSLRRQKRKGPPGGVPNGPKLRPKEKPRSERGAGLEVRGFQQVRLGACQLGAAVLWRTNENPARGR